MRLVGEKLRVLSHIFTDCTPYGQTFSTVGESLAYRCNKANASGSQFHLCIRFNCGGGHGVEAYITSATGRDYGNKLCNEISTLGFTNRGIKDGSGLYVVKNTNMPCVLLEVAFVDSVDDMALYNAETVANAIVKAITGQVVIAETRAISTVQPEFVVPNDNNIVPVGANITQLNGGGWLERAEDGRTIVHQSRSTYLALTVDGHLDFYANGQIKRLV